MWEKIRHEWETTDVTFKELAEKYGLKDSTVRSRKNREKWERNNATQRMNATQRKRNVATERKTSEPGEKERFEPTVENDELTDKQRLFCIYYIKYFNATKAYQKAYGCAYSTAMVQGHHHLRNPKINAEIDRLKLEQANELKLDVRDVLQKYIDIAFADITDYAEFGKKEVQAMGAFGPLEDDEGNPVMVEVNYVDFKDSTEVDGTIITEVKKGKDGVSVKLADKMKALEYLAKYTDLLSENDKKRLQEEKLKAEIAKVKGDDGDEYEDDGFLNAIKSTVDIWDDENE